MDSVPPVLLEEAVVAAAVVKKKRALCSLCFLQLNAPYEVVHPETGATLRAVHIKSRLIRPARAFVKGLVALDPMPAGTAIPYPGHIVDEVSLAQFEEAKGKQFTRAYARGGPKDRGVKTVILGQLAPRHPKNCGHLINCGKGLARANVNARWGETRVDAAFFACYPATDAKLGDLYPVVRLSRDVAVGEELILASYGSSYWQHHAKEKGVKTIGARALPPSLKRQLEELDDPRGRAKRHRANDV